MFIAISALYQAPDCHIKIADEVVETVIIFLTARLCDTQIVGGPVWSDQITDQE